MEDTTIQSIEASMEAQGMPAGGAPLRLVLSSFYGTPLALLPEKAEEISAFLQLRIHGQLSDEEIKARISRPARTSIAAPKSGVAVIPVSGVIAKRMGMMDDISGGTSIERLRADFHAALGDPDIGHIVFDVNSPGGSVEGVFEFSEEIFNARGQKRMTTVANDLIASAAYAIGSACDEVVVTPGALAGSIGVYLMHADVSAMDRMLGIKTTLIKAGKYKAEGDPHQPLSAEAIAHKQEMVDDYYEMFVNAVARNRATTPDQVRNGYGEGRVLTAERAVAADLADRVATLDEVLAELGVSAAASRTRAGAPAEPVAVSIMVDGVDLAAAEILAASAGDIRILTPLDGMAAETAADAEITTPSDVAGGTSEHKGTPPIIEPAPVARENTVDKDTAAQDGAGTQAQVNPSEADVARRDDIVALCAAHGAPSELAQEYIQSGKTKAEAGQDLLRRKREGLDAFSQPAIEMRGKDAKRYSITRAIMAAADDDWSQAGFEREIDQELRANLPSDYKPKGGILIPTRIRMVDGLEHPRGQLKTSGATAGQTLVFTEPGDFIDLLRNKMVLSQLGATFLTGLQGNVSFPKQTGAGTFEWVGEDPGSDQSDADATLGQVALNAKEGQSTTAYTRKLLAQANIDVDALVAMDLSTITGLGIELGAIAGTGLSNQPTGILNTDSIGDVALGVNGDVPTYEDIVDLETAVADANADIGSMAYLTTAGMRGVLKKQAQLSNTSALPVWQGNEMNGYPAAISNGVPRTLEKGGSSTCHAIIFGVWSQLLVGYWGAYELIVDPYSKKKQGLIELTSHQIVGVAVRHPESFAAIQDALTTAYSSS